MQSDNPPWAVGCLLRISERLIIWDPLAEWPLPTSLASPAAPASIAPYGYGTPAATPAHCSQRHHALLSPCAFVQAGLSAQPPCPSCARHLENCLKSLSCAPPAKFAHLLLVIID